MLKSVTVSKVASFGESCQKFGDLGAVNFVYGSNGSGKTTISRLIASPEKFGEECSLEWEGGVPLAAFVYNRDFVEANFAPSKEIKGVFTLGAGDKAIVDAIDEKKRNIDELTTKIVSLNNDLTGESGKIALLEKCERDIESYCWDKIRTPNDMDFKVIFKGLLSSKAKFKQKVVSLWYAQNGKKSQTVRTREELSAEIKSVFSADSSELTLVPSLNIGTLPQDIANPIFSQVIVGSSDIDIAQLINSLGISDWVRQGQAHMVNSLGKCPFCQQVLPDGFATKLDKYFDESFSRNMNQLKVLSEEISGALDSMLKCINEICAIETSFFDASGFKIVADKLLSKADLIKRMLGEKQREPSRSVKMPDILPEISLLCEMISTSNVKIQEHNRLIDDKAASEQRLVDETWRFLIEEHRSELKKLFTNKENCEKAKLGVKHAKEEKEREKMRAETELRELQRKQTSVLPTIDTINAVLSSFGFDSFRLAPATDTTYKLQRADGSEVNDTLSEGERSFVTFLYFYHLLKGSVSSENVSERRIAVIDDPVSSLDSNILFVVASLVRQCVKDVQAGNTPLKQLIVLTHNVYFHKELTFSRERDKTKSVEYWIVRKQHNNSTISQTNGNPVKTSYELLWREIQDPASSLVCVQNAMRRILEFYFNILGGMNREEIESEFNGREAFIVKSLFLWVNDGSHTVDDDLAYQVNEESVDLYRNVFARIFKELHHENHYNMMMRNCQCRRDELS